MESSRTIRRDSKLPQAFTIICTTVALTSAPPKSFMVSSRVILLIYISNLPYLTHIHGVTADFVVKLLCIHEETKANLES